MVSLLDTVLEKVGSTDCIRVATLFGSQARKLLDRQDGADHHSDIDLQIVTTDVAPFESESWFHSLRDQRVVLCARRSVFGGVIKFTVLFERGVLDCVIVPYFRLNLGRLSYRCGLHRRIAALKRGLMSFTDLMRFEHVVLKGDARWKAFYRDASAELPRIGLSDGQVRQIANLAYVDAIAVLSRVARGELVAARRLFFQSVLETNLQLIQESRERRGLRAYHRGRRAERVMDSMELAAVSLESSLQPESLCKATKLGIGHCADLVASLLGERPKWPPLPSGEDGGNRAR